MSITRTTFPSVATRAHPLAGKTSLIAAVALTALMVVILAWSNVDTALTPEDVVYIRKFYPAVTTRPPSNEAEQLRLIERVQAAVIDRALLRHDIAEGHSREPRDVWNARSGLCYDVSRTIEKILTYQGFEVRHLYIGHARTTGLRGMAALFENRLLSHAVTEVKTAAGWVVVDSTSKWLSLDARGLPVSVRSLHQHMGHVQDLVGGEVPDLLKGNFFVVVGLYSRHGRFYPPFNAIPDIAWGQLFQGMVELI